MSAKIDDEQLRQVCGKFQKTAALIDNVLGKLFFSGTISEIFEFVIICTGFINPF